MKTTISHGRQSEMEFLNVEPLSGKKKTVDCDNLYNTKVISKQKNHTRRYCKNPVHKSKWNFSILPLRRQGK